MKQIAVALFMAGLILAGSDGEWFPWINFAGLGMMAIVVVAAREEGAARRAPTVAEGGAE
jgi:hypothetical protein